MAGPWTFDAGADPLALAAELEAYARAGLDEAVFGPRVRTAEQYRGMMRFVAERVRPLVCS